MKPKATKSKPKSKGNAQREYTTHTFSSKLDTNEINPRTRNEEKQAPFGRSALQMTAPLKSLNR